MDRTTDITWTRGVRLCQWTSLSHGPKGDDDGWGKGGQKRSAESSRPRTRSRTPRVLRSAADRGTAGRNSNVERIETAMGANIGVEGKEGPGKAKSVGEGE